MSLLTLLKPKDTGFTPPVGTFVANDSPRLIVEIDFANDPTVVNRTWTDITTFVRDISYQRDGRQHELQRTEAGTLTALLDNRDGRFDPTFDGISAGSFLVREEDGTSHLTREEGGGDLTTEESTATSIGYYPGVKRTRWIRVRAVWNNIIYPRWQGLIENYDGEWPSVGKDATVTITASTTMKILNLFDLNGHSYVEQDTGNRVASIAYEAGIQGGGIYVGVSTVPAVAFTSPTSALSHLQQVEETENGLLFTNEEGNLAFQSRHHRLLYSAVSLGTIGDLAGEIPYGPVRFEYDDANIWNHVVVTPASIPDQEIPDPPGDASDQTSIDQHYERTLNRGLLATDSVEAQSAAEFLVTKYKDPPPRISTVEVIGRADTTKWPLILAANNSDRYLWRRRPSTEGAPRTIELDVYVERVAEQITPGSRWTTTFQLSPASTTYGWILGTSALGVDTALTY